MESKVFWANDDEKQLANNESMIRRFVLNISYLSMNKLTKNGIFYDFVTYFLNK